MASADRRRHTSRKTAPNLCINLVLSLAATVAALSLVELVLRLSGHRDVYAVSVYEQGLFTQRSPTTLTPNFQGEFLSPEIGGPIAIRINSKGLRDVERTYRKQGAYRIVALGDSFAFGHGVDFEQSFLTILEAKLKRGVNERIEIIKAVVPGTGLSFYRELLAAEGMRYDPDLVLVNVFVGNDLDDVVVASREAERVVADGGGRSFQRTLYGVKRWLRAHLHIYSFAVDRLKAHPRIRRALNASGLAGGLIGSQVIDVLKKPSPDGYAMKWRLAGEILKDIKEQCPNVAVVVIPSREQVDADRLRRAVKQVGYTLDEIDRFHPSEQMAALCRQLDMPCIDLTPRFIQVYSTERTPLFFESEIEAHFNARGHALAAEMISADLQPHLRVEAAHPSRRADLR